MKNVKWISFALLVGSVLAIVIGLANMSPVSKVERPEYGKEDYLREANRYYDNSAYMQAVVSYENALELDEDDTEIYMKLADCYSRMNNIVKEGEIRKRITEIDESNVENWYSYILISIRAGELDEAMKMTEEAMKTVDSEELNELYNQMKIDKPVISLATGSYDDYQLVTIGGVENCSYYYTLDGTNPDETSERYSDDGIVISNPQTTLKVVAVGYLGYKSEIAEADYTITKPIEKITGYKNLIGDVKTSILKKGWDSDVYNYELAQVRELHILGDYSVWGKDESREVSFKANSYKMYSSNYTTKGRWFEFEDLKYMPFLKTLTIGYQENLSMKDINELKNLEYLSILNCDVSDISGIQGLTKLRMLSLGWNNISDVSSISKLPNLESLGLWNNDISDISSLGSLDKLSYFDISNNKVRDISCVSNMSNLRELWVNGNNISDFTPLNNCTGISTLMVTGNASTDYGVWNNRKNDLVKTDME